MPWCYDTGEINCERPGKCTAMDLVWLSEVGNITFLVLLSRHVKAVIIEHHLSY
jgi:hypothetical protein